MIYAQLVPYIFQQNREGPKDNLDHIREGAQILGNPHESYQIVHITGTNGKGTVSKGVADALQAIGKRVGLLASPHVVDYRERFTINGAFVTKEEVEKTFNFVIGQFKEAQLQLSFFELTTLCAFQLFKEKKVEWAVVEVGIGGKIDMTNIVNPKLSIITSIALDHTKILGETIEEITRKKAGIIKKGVPVVIGPTVPLGIVEEYAKPLEAPIHRVDKDIPENYEALNWTIVERACSVLQIKCPEKLVPPPCRFQIFETKERKVVLDVGHNPEALKRCLDRMRHVFPNQKADVIFALGPEKDLEGCLKVLKTYTSSLFLPMIENPRLRLNTAIAQAAQKEFTVTMGPAETLLNHTGKLTLVCGSFYMMETFLDLLK